MTVCPRCGQQTSMIVVHGHYQCQICKSIVDDCCSGLTCQKPSVEEEFKLKPIPKANYGRGRNSFTATLVNAKPSKKEMEAKRLADKAEKEKQRLAEVQAKRLKIWEELYGGN